MELDVLAEREVENCLKIRELSPGICLIQDKAIIDLHDPINASEQGDVSQVQRGRDVQVRLDDFHEGILKQSS